MTMLSFRIDASDAAGIQRWAERLGVDRSSVLRDAVRLHLVRLEGEHDVDAWIAVPVAADETALDDVADWGPAEDWSDWADAQR
jgi:hypothetical protein